MPWTEIMYGLLSCEQIEATWLLTMVHMEWRWTTSYCLMMDSSCLCCCLLSRRLWGIVPLISCRVGVDGLGLCQCFGMPDESAVAIPTWFFS